MHLINAYFNYDELCINNNARIEGIICTAALLTTCALTLLFDTCQFKIHQRIMITTKNVTYYNFASVVLCILSPKYATYYTIWRVFYYFHCYAYFVQCLWLWLNVLSRVQVRLYIVSFFSFFKKMLIIFYGYSRVRSYQLLHVLTDATLWCHLGICRHF